MDSSRSNKLWDLVRLRYVEATPEETIRQKWLSLMIRQLGYPRGLLAVEKQISTSRRFDILCYQTDGKPLLVIECKSGTSPRAKEQLQGYNETLGAPFLCLIEGDRVKTFWKENGKIASCPFLPKYKELLAQL